MSTPNGAAVRETVANRVAEDGERLVDRAESLINRLCDRLQPILRQTSPVPPGAPIALAEYPMFFDTMRTQQQRIDQALDLLESVLDRLEV